MPHANCRVLTTVSLALALMAGIAGAQSVIATITVGRGPTAIIYDSIDDKVFVANQGSGTVSVIDPHANSVTEAIRVDPGANAMCWSRTSNKIFVSCAPVTGNGSVCIIDAATNRVVGRLPVGRNPMALAWCSSRNKVYCVNSAPGGPISVLGGADSEGKDVPVIPIPGQKPNAIIYNSVSDRIYVSSAVQMGPGSVWVIDPALDRVQTSVTCGFSAWELGLNPEDNRVYCSNRGSESVSVIDCSTHQRLANIPTEGEPHPVCWIPPDKIFIGEYWNGTVAFMHGESLSIAGRFPVPGHPGSMVYLPSSQKLFVANYLTGIVSACDARDGHEQVLVDLPVGGGPLDFAVHPGLRHIYVTNSWDSTVTVIADELPAAASEPRSLARGSGALSVRPNPAHSRAFVNLGKGVARPSPLRVHDITGKVVLERTVSGDAFEMDCRGLAPGIYFVRVLSPGRTQSARLTIK